MTDTETLNITIARAAEEWTTQDLEAIVAGLRSQRERWNIEQQKGSRKLVQSKSVATGVSAKAAKLRGTIL